jgi:hypothetical protein
MRFASRLGGAVVRLSKGTNDISRSCLFQASRGRVSISLLDLATAICMGADARRFLDGASSVMAVGHTCGMDAVTVLLLGLVA